MFPFRRICFITSFEICILTSLGLFEFMKVAALLEALESHLFILQQKDDISENHDRQGEGKYLDYHRDWIQLSVKNIPCNKLPILQQDDISKNQDNISENHGQGKILIITETECNFLSRISPCNKLPTGRGSAYSVQTILRGLIYWTNFPKTEGWGMQKGQIESVNKICSLLKSWSSVGRVWMVGQFWWTITVLRWPSRVEKWICHIFLFKYLAAGFMTLTCYLYC